MNSLSPEARKLLDSSRAAGGPTAAQRAAMKQAVLAAVLVPGTAAASAAGSAAASGTKTIGLALVAKLGLAVIVAGVGATLLWQPGGPARVTAEPVAQGPSDLLAPPPQAAAELAPEPVGASEGAIPPTPPAAPPSPGSIALGARARPVAPTALSGVPSPEPAAHAAGALSPVREAPPPQPASPEPEAASLPGAAVDEATLSREIAALSGAMGAVDRKSFPLALEQLSGYRAAFPAGVLAAEASVLEVLALCGLGRVEEAKAAAASLPANNPAVRRLDRSCIALGR